MMWVMCMFRQLLMKPNALILLPDGHAPIWWAWGGGGEIACEKLLYFIISFYLQTWIQPFYSVTCSEEWVVWEVWEWMVSPAEEDGGVAIRLRHIPEDQDLHSTFNECIRHLFVRVFFFFFFLFVHQVL